MVLFLVVLFLVVLFLVVPTIMNVSERSVVWCLLQYLYVCVVGEHPVFFGGGRLMGHGNRFAVFGFRFALPLFPQESFPNSRQLLDDCLILGGSALSAKVLGI